MPTLAASPQALLTRWGQLKGERAPWLAHWQALSAVLLPSAGRYSGPHRSPGTPRFHEIIDSTGTRAVRVLAAGMMSGMTSPARPWFRLAAAEPALMRSPEVKRWLHQVTQRMLDIFQRSNTYRTLHTLYEELAVFGTAASVVMDDYHEVIRHYPLTAGEYAIATNHRGEVDTLYREFQQTVGQVVKAFGLSHVSPTVRNLYERGNLEQSVPLLHAIEPRADRVAGRRDAQHMAWRSVYLEVGREQDQPLRESGFTRFPALTPRWTTTGGDRYGTSPGMEALGDIRQLQQEQQRKAQGIDYMTHPPVLVPTECKDQEKQLIPGGVLYSNQLSGVQTAFQVKLDLNHLLADIQDVRERIKGVFYADLFLMLANLDNTTMTATEVAERHEEKLLMLGPVLERLHNELLAPLIELTFARLVQTGLLPPIPPPMQGQALNIEFVSMLAQAQRAMGVQAIDRFVAHLGEIAQIKPEALDKFNVDAWVEEYADRLGVNPDMIVANEQVAFIREQRAAQQQQAQQLATLAQGAQTANTLAAAPTGEKNALTDAINAFSGYGPAR